MTLKDMETAVTLNQKEKQSLLEAIQMMSEFFWGPRPEFCQAMRQTPFWQSFEEILPRLGTIAVQIFESLKSIPRQFSNSQDFYNALEEEYIRSIISNRHGIQAPLYASCYTEDDSVEKGPLMGEPALVMQRRLQSKGLSLAADIGEPPDHLSIELEYLFFLLGKGWDEADPKLIEEAGFFVEETVLPWVSKLKKNLATGEAPGVFYPLLVTLLVALLELIVRHASGV